MKLEVKHLAGYLPYELDTKYLLSKVVNIPRFKDELRDKKLTAANCDFVLQFCKPILYPLSDLTKYIDNFCFEEWVQESSCPEEYEQYTRCIYETFDDGELVDLHYLSYRIIKKMYEYHFDVYRLIDAGLAIDINKLNK